jgi:hypothetical protein
MRVRTTTAVHGPRAAFVALGLTLLLAAWIMATPPFAAPDEGSHYLRALTITNGQILGPKASYPQSPLLTPTQLAFLQHDTRAVTVPAVLSPTDVNCVNGARDLSGSCVEVTPNGNFPPIGYLLPAVALGVSHDTASAIWLSRLGAALPCVVFLILAVVFLWAGTAWSLLGLLTAVTPMVLFSSSIMNASGIQITGSLAFFATGVRITRAPAESTRWVWAAFAVSGAVTILAGPIGFAFALADLALLGALLGRDGLGDLRGRSAEKRVTALALASATVLWAIYTRIAGFHGTFGISPIGAGLRAGVGQLPPVLHDAVGTFGSLTVHLPLPAYWLWWLIVIGLVVGGFWLAESRDRVLLGAVVVLALLFPVLFYAWIDRHTGYGLQGREVLPVLLLIPLAAGEIVYRRRSVITGRRYGQPLLAGSIAVIAAFQAYAWWYNARAMAVGQGGILFYRNATWSPPLGWGPWIGAAAIGALALMTFALTEVRSPQRSSATRSP